MLADEIKEIYSKSLDEEKSKFDYQININYNNLISKIKDEAKNLRSEYRVSSSDITTCINYIFKNDVISTITSKLKEDGFKVSPNDDVKYCLLIEW